MIELAKHIELLLLENDCVVIPDFGGFITHYKPAHYNEDEGLFLPPQRTIGFNPQLTMNDGLLVQSYMQVHHTDFPDATRKVEKTVEQIKEQLYSEGIVELFGIGIIRYNIHGTYEFEPNESGVLSPSLYALDSFSMPFLAKVVTETESYKNIDTTFRPVAERKEFKLNYQLIRNVAAVAIAIVMFFVSSAPVENTYIDKGSYASLGTDCLFDAIRSHSMATSLTEVAPQQKTKQEVKPLIVKVEKVTPAPTLESDKKEIVPAETQTAPEIKKVQEVKKAEKAKELKVQAKPRVNVSKPQAKYHIIVASLATSADAQQSLKNLQNKGYTEASVVEGSGRFRISLYNYKDKNTAYNKLNELKLNDAFKSAWLLTSK